MGAGARVTQGDMIFRINHGVQTQGGALRSIPGTLFASMLGSEHNVFLFPPVVVAVLL